MQSTKPKKRSQWYVAAMELENSPLFQIAKKECNRWGIEVQFSSMERYKVNANLYTSGDGFLIDMQLALICIDTAGVEVRGTEATPYTKILHEMAHIVVGISPSAVDEGDAMLALEKEALTRLRLDWRSHMADWETPEGLWCDTATQYRHKLLKEAFESAEKNGFLKNGKPTYNKKSFGGWQWDMK